jgi:hypothetical protein
MIPAFPPPAKKQQEVSMKIPLHPMGNCGNAVLHLSLFAAFLAGLIATGCGPKAPTVTQVQPSPQTQQTPFSPQSAAAPAAASSILGQWRTTTSVGTITIAFMSNGQYDQTGVGTTGVQTMQAGPYQLVPPNNIVFTVATWSPHSRVVLVPCGIPGDPVCNVQRVVNYPKPPGTKYAYVFNGPNSMRLSNQTGPITFTRIAGQ